MNILYVIFFVLVLLTMSVVPVFVTVNGWRHRTELVRLIRQLLRG